MPIREIFIVFAIIGSADILVLSDQVFRGVIYVDAHGDPMPRDTRWMSKDFESNAPISRAMKKLYLPQLPIVDSFGRYTEQNRSAVLSQTKLLHPQELSPIRYEGIWNEGIVSGTRN